MSAAVAAVLLAELLRGIRLPVVVLEIALGILVGPQVLHSTDCPSSGWRC
jgi:Kef-type K+ transport system membrane component KefB